MSLFRASLPILAASALCLATLVGAAAEDTNAQSAAPSSPPAAAPQTGAAPSATPQPMQTPKWAQRWEDDRAAMLDAKLAGLKAGLRLTPDQEKLWGPFEAAVRGVAQLRMARMQAMIEHMQKARAGDDGASDMAMDEMSPLDRLDMTASRMLEVGGALKNLANTAKPLYGSLDDQQKRMFGYLSREMMKIGRGPDARVVVSHDEDDSDDDE